MIAAGFPGISMDLERIYRKLNEASATVRRRARTHAEAKLEPSKFFSPGA
jgi:hypothetical protein